MPPKVNKREARALQLAATGNWVPERLWVDVAAKLEADGLLTLVDGKAVATSKGSAELAVFEEAVAAAKP